jgi:cysteine desulfurase
MGLDGAAEAGAIRVSLGPATTKEEVERFAETWARLFRRYRAKVA